MEEENKIYITVKTTVSAPIEKVWEKWTNPDDIVRWNNASEDWHTTQADNDLRVGGKFSARMEAKDGSIGFDFWGVYDEIRVNEYIEYTLGDGRKVIISFSDENDKIKITETFEAEKENSVELQKTGWQSIMDSFKKYVESE